MTGAGYQWDEADRLFDEALDLPPGERERWLDRRCAGRPALRRQVESLLRADAAATGFLEVEGRRVADLPAEGAERGAAGHEIGPYRVVRELARGGMGVVYLAGRADGQPDQRVALKLVRKGLDSDRIHRRFLAERRILGRLDHRNIARLLDGGITDDGQPWFAMEFVEGSTIVAHSDARGLGVPDRLRLLLEVCAAVHYAHGRLVIHRDLKPGNILVTADGRVKLLDFGIAKVVEGDDEAGTQNVTRTADRILTPEYAAPEQVRGEPVTAATDVYALGVVLYELLTGRRAQPLARRTPTEIVKAVLLSRPQPPSTVAPGERQAALRGELDAIVLRALEKEPGRRHQTVAALADEIGRCLDSVHYRDNPHPGRTS
ncbi:MAG TPA: serine/threonine-protein kinase [Gemmatimonadales bacterium]